MKNENINLERSYNKGNVEDRKRIVVDPIANRKFRKLHVEKYISGDKNAVEEILSSLKIDKKILITGAMGIGKTHFIRTDLFNYAKSIGKKVIMVIPGVAQLQNLQINKGLSVVYAEVGYYKTDIVAVTPDSLLTKVVSNLPPNSFILVVDEAHQKILDSNFRKAFKNIDIAEKTAYKTIYMTATPRVLKNETFDRTIEITTNDPIRNKVMVHSIKNENKSNLLDMKLSIIKKSLNNYDNVIFFQNNKKLNKDMADILAKGENITKKIYKNKYQYSICTEGQDHTEKVCWEWITRAETVQAGKDNTEAKTGLLTSNITFVTCIITAGIDLRVPKNNKAILIIDATEKIDIDSIIQLIGRFREGINVLILAKSHMQKENKHGYCSFENILKERINISKTIAEIYNENKVKIENYKNDIVTNCIEYSEESKLYSLEQSTATAKAYNSWNILLMHNMDKFIKLIEGQTAFKVNGEIGSCSWLEEKLQVCEEIKDLKAAVKKEFNKIKEEILQFDDEALLAAITKKYEKLETNQVDIAKTYHKLKPNFHKEHLKITGELFIDEEVVDVVKSFRYFYTNPWVTIQKEINAMDAKLINLDFKLSGIETFLSKDLYKIRTQKRQQQAKIRFELHEIGKKQGRISNKIIDIITEKMIEEGYFKNKNTKVYLDNTVDDSERKKAFKVLKEIVINIIEITYNITEDKRISSVKY